MVRSENFTDFFIASFISKTMQKIKEVTMSDGWTVEQYLKAGNTYKDLARKWYQLDKHSCGPYF